MLVHTGQNRYNIVELLLSRSKNAGDSDKSYIFILIAFNRRGCLEDKEKIY